MSARHIETVTRGPQATNGSPGRSSHCIFVDSIESFYNTAMETNKQWMTVTFKVLQKFVHSKTDFSYFSEKIRLVITCVLSAKMTIHMNCQTLFCLKKKCFSVVCCNCD